MYKNTMLFFSQDAIATITYVIPTIDWVDAMLSSSFTEPLSPSVKHALLFTKKSINKYYLKMNLLNVYCIIMGTVLMIFELVPCLIIIAI